MTPWLTPPLRTTPTPSEATSAASAASAASYAGGPSSVGSLLQTVDAGVDSVLDGVDSLVGRLGRASLFGGVSPFSGVSPSFGGGGGFRRVGTSDTAEDEARPMPTPPFGA